MAQNYRIEIGKNTVRHHSIVPHWKLEVPAQKKQQQPAAPAAARVTDEVT